MKGFPGILSFLLIKCGKGNAKLTKKKVHKMRCHLIIGGRVALFNSSSNPKVAPHLAHNLLCMFLVSK